MEKEDRARAVTEWGDTVWRLALLRTGRREDAEDVFQEVFLRYFRHEEALRGAADEHRKAWLIRCTVNRCKSVLTAPWRRRTAPLAAAEDVGVPPETREVYAAVLALPPKYRTAVHLFYYEGYSVSEIASATGAPEGTVKSWLSRARLLLREALSEEVTL